jgi:hypothetical protein
MRSPPNFISLSLHMGSLYKGGWSGTLHLTRNVGLKGGALVRLGQGSPGRPQLWAPFGPPQIPRRPTPLSNKGAAGP